MKLKTTLQVAATILILTISTFAQAHEAFASSSESINSGGQSVQTTPPASYAYDVISIRQPKGSPDSGGLEESADGFAMRNLTLQVLIPDAYGIARNDLVTGWPKWATSERFNIDAKMDPDTTEALHKLSPEEQKSARQAMLRSLLETRFHLKVHRATATQTTYDLVLAKTGSKLKEDNPERDLKGNKFQEGVTPAADWQISESKITGHAMPIRILASHLEGPLNTIVTDKTGLASRYDINLEWNPADTQFQNLSDSASPPAPPLFTAVEEQLGLKLKPVKTNVETLVIDHLEMPTAN